VKLPRLRALSYALWLYLKDWVFGAAFAPFVATADIKGIAIARPPAHRSPLIIRERLRKPCAETKAQVVRVISRSVMFLSRVFAGITLALNTLVCVFPQLLVELCAEAFMSGAPANLVSLPRDAHCLLNRPFKPHSAEFGFVQFVKFSSVDLNFGQSFCARPLPTKNNKRMAVDVIFSRIVMRLLCRPNG
jgi:hypothetical protein